MTNKSRSKQQKQASMRQRKSVRKNRQNVQKKSVKKQQKRNSNRQTQKKQKQKQSYRKQRQSQRKQNCKKRKQRKQKGGYTMFGQSLAGSFLPMNERGVFDVDADYTAQEVVNLPRRFKGRSMFDAERDPRSSADERLSGVDSVFGQVDDGDAKTKEEMDAILEAREDNRLENNAKRSNAEAETLGDLSERINEYQDLKRRYDEFYEYQDLKDANELTADQKANAPRALTGAEKNKLARFGDEDGTTWRRNSEVRKEQLQEIVNNSEDAQLAADAQALLDRYANQFSNFEKDLTRNDHVYPE